MEGTVASARVRLAGRGRNHAVRLAEAGGDIIAVDVCAQVETTPVATARLRLRTHASGKMMLKGDRTLGDASATRLSKPERPARLNGLPAPWLPTASVTTTGPRLGPDARLSGRWCPMVPAQRRRASGAPAAFQRRRRSANSTA
jgi:hypothetical protein